MIHILERGYYYRKEKNEPRNNEQTSKEYSLKKRTVGVNFIDFLLFNGN